MFRNVEGSPYFTPSLQFFTLPLPPPLQSCNNTSVRVHMQPSMMEGRECTNITIPPSRCPHEQHDVLCKCQHVLHDPPHPHQPLYHYNFPSTLNALFSCVFVLIRCISKFVQQTVVVCVRKPSTLTVVIDRPTATARHTCPHPTPTHSPTSSKVCRNNDELLR